MSNTSIMMQCVIYPQYEHVDNMCLNPHVILNETFCCSSGLPVEAAQQGHLQPSANELFSADLSRSDSEHHHVQAGQETQRSVWSPTGEKDGVMLKPILYKI